MGKRHFIMKTTLFLTLWFGAMFPELAGAHFQTIGYSDIAISGTSIQYKLYLDPYELVNIIQGLDANRNLYVEEEEVRQAAGAINQFAAQYLVVKNGGQKGQPRFKGVSLEERGTLPMVLIDLDYPFSQEVSDFEIEYNFFFEKEDPLHQNFAKITNGGEAVETVIQKENHILTPEGLGMKTRTIELPNWTGTLMEYTALGMEHIWLGFDHMLFLLALIIGGGRKWDYIKILTAFTIGHSVTLALSVLDVITISPEIIEPLIALSIVYVAAENIFWKTFQWRWIVTLIFGLIHGFGFSYILKGYMTSSYVLSLFSFNLGVELGQLVVLAVLLPLVWYLRKKQWQLKVSYSVSGIVGLVGIYWFIERVM